MPFWTFSSLSHIYQKAEGNNYHSWWLGLAYRPLNVTMIGRHYSYGLFSTAAGHSNHNLQPHLKGRDRGRDAVVVTAEKSWDRSGVGGRIWGRRKDRGIVVLHWRGNREVPRCQPVWLSDGSPYWTDKDLCCQLSAAAANMQQQMHTPFMMFITGGWAANIFSEPAETVSLTHDTKVFFFFLQDWPSMRDNKGMGVPAECFLASDSCWAVKDFGDEHSPNKWQAPIISAFSGKSLRVWKPENTVMWLCCYPLHWCLYRLLVIITVWLRLSNYLLSGGRCCITGLSAVSPLTSDPF